MSLALLRQAVYDAKTNFVKDAKPQRAEGDRNMNALGKFPGQRGLFGSGLKVDCAGTKRLRRPFRERRDKIGRKRHNRKRT
jgi:hypothetical protein